jgi:hypothetical protein
MHPRPPLFAGVYRIELLPLARGWANLADNYFVRQMSKSPCGRCGYLPKESPAGAGLDQNYQVAIGNSRCVSPPPSIKAMKKPPRV